jgi:hypothetical protein
MEIEADYKRYKFLKQRVDYRLKAATLAREGQHIFMAAIFAFHMGKADVQTSRAPNVLRLRNRR